MDEKQPLAEQSDNSRTESVKAEDKSTTNPKHKLNVKDELQNLCSLSSDGKEVYWDHYTKYEEAALHTKIRLACIDGGINNEKFKKKVEEKLKKLSDTIWALRIFNGGSLMMAIVPIITLNYKDYCDNIDKVLTSHVYDLHCIFRVRKCIKEKNTRDCCMLFVDEKARVYANWKDFVDCNQFAKVVIVAPKNGFFTLNKSNDILLDVFVTRDCKITASIQRAFDFGLSLGTIGTSAASIGSIIIPPAAPLALVIIGIATMTMTVSSALYSIIKNSMALSDLSKHKESLTSTKAVGYWLGATGGALSLVSLGTQPVVAQLVNNGTRINKAVQISVNLVNIGAMTTNGLGVLNGFLGLYLKYQDGEKPTVAEVAQIGVSLFLFTHSVYNFQTVNAMMKSFEGQSQTDISKNLNDTQKESLKLSREKTINVTGEEAGQCDIVRQLNNNPDTIEAFCDFYKLPKKNFVETSVSNCAYNLPKSYLDVFGGCINESLLHLERSIVETVIPTLTLIAATYTVLNKKELLNTVTNLAHTLNTISLEDVIEIVKQYIARNDKDISTKLNRLIPFEEYLTVTFKIIRTLSQDIPDIDDYIRNAFKDLYSMADIWGKVSSYFTNLKPNGKLSECKDCGGHYYVNVKLD